MCSVIFVCLLLELAVTTSSAYRLHKPKSAILFQGGGIYYYWQAGAGIIYCIYKYNIIYIFVYIPYLYAKWNTSLYYTVYIARYLRDVLKEKANTIPCIGASAGSLTATLMLTGVDFQKATDYVVVQAEREKLFERPFGLAGICLAFSFL